jgi:hypothetical protein
MSSFPDPFNLKGGEGYGFLFCSELFFRTTQELEYIFFMSQNLTLGYMTKTLNQIFFFSPPKSEYFLRQHWEPVNYASVVVWSRQSDQI